MKPILFVLTFCLFIQNPVRASTDACMNSFSEIGETVERIKREVDKKFKTPKSDRDDGGIVDTALLFYL